MDVNLRWAEGRGCWAWGKREDWEGFCERVPGDRKMVQISGHPPRILCSYMERKQRYRKFRLELPTWEAGLHGDFSADPFFGCGHSGLCACQVMQKNLLQNFPKFRYLAMPKNGDS